MSKNLLVINVDIREVRVALIENGIIAELHIERAHNERCFGNVVLGRVTRVLPGMQAAFIDVGLDKAAFLHVEDLIRPDDFEGYLAGTKRSGSREEVIPEAPELEAPAPADSDRLVAPSSPESASSHQSASMGKGPASSSESVPGQEALASQSTSISEGQPLTVQEGIELSFIAVGKALTAVDGGAETVEVEAPAAGGRPSSLADAQGSAEAKPMAMRSSRRRRGRGSGPSKQRAGASPGRERRKELEGGRRGGDRNSAGKSDHGRIDKHTPIREVIREGQEILVQISKEPIGTKGARVTSHISLPGRYVVYLPTVDYIGISKRIGSEKERSRLREAIEGMRPPSGGLIVRTVAEGLTKKQLKADVGYLVRLWGEIVKNREGAKAPDLIFEELDLVLKVAREMFTDEIEQIVIDDKAQYERLVRFVEMFMPERTKNVEFYQGDEPLFDAYGIEEEISRSLARKVPLPSGGYLIIDEAEALTAIDVNTGRFVGKGSKDHEETILKTNLEAVEEIAYQLRFRNLGGLIVLDLIDMERPSSREHVRRRLEEVLQKDKAKTSLNRISDLGLIEMTRKRTRESLGRLLHEPCFYCDGTGQIQSKTTTIYEILRTIRRERNSLPGYTVVVNAHPDVIALMRTTEHAAVQEAERRFMRRIDLAPRKEYHLEQFDLVGR